MLRCCSAALLGSLGLLAAFSAFGTPKALSVEVVRLVQTVELRDFGVIINSATVAVQRSIYREMKLSRIDLDIDLDIVDPNLGTFPISSSRVRLADARMLTRDGPDQHRVGCR